VLVLASRHGEDEVHAGTAGSRREEGTSETENAAKGGVEVEGAGEDQVHEGGDAEGTNVARSGHRRDGGRLAGPAARLLRSRPVVPLARRHRPTQSVTVSITSLTTSP
jgi:hypothetical protein